MISLGSAEQALWLLLECTIKSSMLVLLTLGLNRLLRKSSAAVRHAAWAACLLAVLCLPVFVYLLPGWQSAVAETALSLLSNDGSSQTGPEDRGLLPFAISASAKAQSPALPLTLLTVWAAGAALSLLLLMAGFSHLAWTAARAKPLFIRRWLELAAELAHKTGVRKPVRLLQSRRASMPLTWGVVQPRILLPAGAEHWSPEQMRIVLAHELAHVGRRDWAMQLLAEFCRAFYWFNPLIHLACDRLRRESEQACDDTVLNAGIEGTAYAEQLLKLARTLPSAQRPWSVALAMARSSSLERRFIAMMNTSIPRHGLSRGAALLTVLASVAVVLPLAALQAPGQSAPARFHGTVHDPSGAAVPNATVIMSNRAANTRDMTATNDAGFFEFNGLSTGEHTLEILKPGFERFRVENLKLAAYDSKAGKYTLNIGKITDTIEVRAEGVARASSATTMGPPTRLRIGGNVQAAKMINKVLPAYPLAAKSAGIEGLVVLDAVISREGVPLALRVANSQIDSSLAKAAVEAVSQWRYQPTLLNGEPVEVATQINVNFSLQK